MGEVKWRFILTLALSLSVKDTRIKFEMMDDDDKEDEEPVVELDFEALLNACGTGSMETVSDLVNS